MAEPWNTTTKGDVTPIPRSDVASSAPLPAPGTTPPRAGASNVPGAAGPPSSLDNLRNTRQQLQTALDNLRTKIAKRPPPDNVPESTEDRSIQDYLSKIADLDGQILKAEQTARTANTPQVVESSLGPNSRYKWAINPDGTLSILGENEGYTGDKNTPQIVTHGAKTYVITPNASDPSKPTVTVAINDQDAQAVTAAQTRVAETTAAAAKSNADTNALIARTNAAIAEAKKNGTDAESIRLAGAQELEKAQQEWVRADGDRKAAQDALNALNAERHATNLEGLRGQEVTARQQEVENNKRWQEMQDATTRRDQDLKDRQHGETTRAGLTNQRLESGQAYAGNVMSFLEKLNASVDPGSDAVANMLIPMMNMGQNFFSNLGGLEDPFSPAAKQGAAAGAAGAAVTPPGEYSVAQTVGTLSGGRPISNDGSAYASVDDVMAELTRRRGPTGLVTAPGAPVESSADAMTRAAGQEAPDYLAQARAAMGR